MSDRIFYPLALLLAAVLIAAALVWPQGTGAPEAAFLKLSPIGSRKAASTPSGLSPPRTAAAQTP